LSFIFCEHEPFRSHPSSTRIPPLHPPLQFTSIISINSTNGSNKPHTAKSESRDNKEDREAVDCDEKRKKYYGFTADKP